MTTIVRVVQLYADSFNSREGGPVDGPDPVWVDMLKEAFHEDAWIFFTEPDGTLRPSFEKRKLRGMGGVRQRSKFPGEVVDLRDQPSKFLDSRAGQGLDLAQALQQLGVVCLTGVGMPPVITRRRGTGPG